VSQEGFHTSELDLVMRVPGASLEAMARWLPAEGIVRDRPLVVVHPGCSMPARAYPWEMYAQLADQLIEDLGCRVLMTGAPEEVGLVERIRGAMRRTCLSAAGSVSFREFAALLALADLVVTNNTGPAHMAAALKTPVVDLFALTNPPEQWGPWRVPHRMLYQEVPCRLCYSRVCPLDHQCLRGVDPSRVAAAARELLVEAAEGRQRGRRAGESRALTLGVGGPEG
jgi:ADP-heptose:LPS heptosyltransferase